MYAVQFRGNCSLSVMWNTLYYTLRSIWNPAKFRKFFRKFNHSFMLLHKFTWHFHDFSQHGVQWIPQNFTILKFNKIHLNLWKSLKFYVQSWKWHENACKYLKKVLKNLEKPVNLCEFHNTVLKLCTVCNVMVFIKNVVSNSNKIFCSLYNQVQYIMKFCKF